MKIELKHIIGYLPYGLKCTEGELIGIRNHIGWMGEFKFEYGSTHIPVHFIKPILHPMSDLSEYHIAVLRQIRFQNSEQWTKQHWNYIKEVKSFPGLQILLIVEKLYEWNFDIHGLIENNLAIDINTLS